MSTLRLKLYVAGNSPNSIIAQNNIEELCKKEVTTRYKLEIIDVLKDPLAAINDGVLITPLLVKVSPSPLKRILGNLSDRNAVLFGLGLKSL